MTKTIVLGLGGTGLAAIRELRRLIAERYEAGLQAPEVERVKFLYIDTHLEDIPKYTWSVLGKDIRLTDGEKVIITGDRLQAMVDRPNDYPDIAPWLPPVQQYIGDPGNGAKGIRPYGRLIYEYSGNKEVVKDKCVSGYNFLNQQFRQDPNWRIYLVCGLSGGTGSGMFLPLSKDFISWNIHQRNSPSQKFYSFLILPALQVVGRHNRYFANAYAALKELNYYAFQPERLPFDNCYLLEPRNANGLQIGLDNLPLVIAQRIFLNIQAGEAASFAAGIMDNPDDLGQVEDDKETGRRHSLIFSTFGLAVVSYPREVIAQCLALSLSTQVIDQWLKEKSYPENVNELTRKDLTSMLLSLAHIKGDIDPFGRHSFNDYEIEIANMVETALQGVARGQLGQSIDRIRQEIEEGFREIGINPYYQQLENDLDGAVDKIIKQVRIKLSSLFRDPHFGVVYAGKFLEELLEILEESRGIVNKLADSKKGATFRRNLTEAANAIRTNEQRFTYAFTYAIGDGAFQRDKANASDQLQKYLKEIACVRVGRYGTALLNKVILKISDSLKPDLEKWVNRMTDVKAKVSGRLEETLKEQEKGTKENGRSIFNTESLNQLLNRINSNMVQSAMEACISQYFKQAPEELDLFEFLDLEQSGNLLEFLIPDKLTYNWLLSEVSIGVKRLTLYDRFVDEIREPQIRQEILREAHLLSAPFLRFAPQEVGLRPIHPTQAKITTIPDSEGRISSDGQPTKTVIRQDLLAVGIADSDIKVATDQERIVFLQEKQAFPLRFIEILSVANGLRDSYDRYPEKSALHIDKQIQSSLYELFLLSTDERNQLLEAEEIFVIARALEWLRKTENRYSHTLEICYEFLDPVSNAPDKRLLAPNWDKALQSWNNDVLVLAETDTTQLRDARLRLTQKARDYLAVLRGNPAEMTTFRERLATYLQTLAREYPAGIDDPDYKWNKKVVDRILQRL